MILLPLALSAALMTLAPRDSLELNSGWETVEAPFLEEKPPAQGWAAYSAPKLFDGPGNKGPHVHWLRRSLEIPRAWKGKKVFLRFGGIRWDAHVWLNGSALGSRLEGYSPWELELPAGDAASGPGELLVRCQDWTATFAKPFELKPDLDWDSLRGAPVSLVLAPIGGRYTEYGPWDDISLEARPATRLLDLSLDTSVRQRTLSVGGKLEGPAASSKGLSVEMDVLDGKRTVLRLPADAVKGARFDMVSRFPGVKLWSPEDPHLYVLRISLKDPRGQTLDQLDRTFGFREFWAEGPDFYLNGVKRRLLATASWPPPESLDLEQARQVLRRAKAGNDVAIRFHTQPWPEVWLQAADEVGLMVVDEAALWCDSGGAYAYGDPRFWQNYALHLRGMIGRDAEHCSVVMHSLENELLHCGAGRFDPQVESNLALMAKMARDLDPQRLVTFEADLDPAGSADVIGLHYPHEMPEYTDYPNTADWLDQAVTTGSGGGLLGSRSASFHWDRNKPLYIGEYLWVPQSGPRPGTVFYGDQAYLDPDLYHRLAQGEAWRDQILAYRRAGVSGQCPWTTGLALEPKDMESNLFQVQRESYAPLGFFLREKGSRAFAGTQLVRTLDIFNDSPVTQKLRLDWKFGALGRGKSALSLPPAENSSVTITLAIPMSTLPGEVPFSASLSIVGGARSRLSSDIRVEAPAALAAPPDVKLLLYDPESRWLPLFKGWGLSPEPLHDLSGLVSGKPGAEILILAPGSLGRAAEGSGPVVLGPGDPRRALFAAYLAKGGRILSLEQETLAALPLGLELAARASTMAFPVEEDHPLLRGLSTKDLKFWSPDHEVSHFQVRRPRGNGARALAVTGGTEGLSMSPLVEARAGQGRVVLVQFMAGSRASQDPAALKLIQNSLNYLAGQVASPTKPAWLVAGSKDIPKALDGVGLNYQAHGGLPRNKDLPDVRLLVLVGGGRALAKAGRDLAGFLKPEPRDQDPRTRRALYWHNPDPASLRDLASALGLKDALLVPASGPLSLIQAGHGPLPGLLREDLAWTKPGQGPSWAGTENLDPGIIRAAFKLDPADSWKFLDEPGAMIARAEEPSTGALAGPLVLLDCVAWEDPQAPALKALAYLSSILNALGGDFRPPSQTDSGTFVGPSRMELAAPAELVDKKDDLVSFYAAGELRLALECQAAGTYQVQVAGRSDPAKGGYGHLSLYLDGKKAGGADLASREAGLFSAGKLKLSQGAHELRLIYDNDLYTPPEDRNLFFSGLLFSPLN